MGEPCPTWSNSENACGSKNLNCRSCILTSAVTFTKVWVHIHYLFICVLGSVDFGWSYIFRCGTVYAKYACTYERGHSLQSHTVFRLIVSCYILAIFAFKSSCVAEPNKNVQWNQLCLQKRNNKINKQNAQFHVFLRSLTLEV